MGYKLDNINRSMQASGDCFVKLEELDTLVLLVQLVLLVLLDHLALLAKKESSH